jgi:hypothetical protein
MKIPLVGGHSEGRSPNIAPAIARNWFFEVADGVPSLVSTHGCTTFSTPKVGEVRGGIEYNNLAYFVIGNTLYEVNSGGNATSRGTINTSSGRVSMAHNGNRTGANQQIMIVDGVNGWIYDNTNQTLTEITDVDFVNTLSVTFLDGYFIFAQKNTDRFWITSLYDGTTIDPNDFATAEGDPDTIQGLIANRRELLLFGNDGLEVWYNAGDPDNTFQRYQGGTTQTGCASGDTIARFDNGVAWLTNNKRGDGFVAVLGDGYKPVYISTTEVNYQISKYSTISDAFAYVYSHEGHEFYVLTFPSEKVTWAYDASTKEWHQRGHTIDGVFPNRERFNCHVFAFKKHLFGDISNGNIYELDPSVGTISGDRIPRERVTPIVTDEERRIRIAALQLDMQEGIGDPNVSTDTSMWLSYSKDGGHTFSNELERSMGEAGEYDKRIIWRKLGRARNWIFKFRTWSPNPMVLKGAYARLYGQNQGDKGRRESEA